MGIFSGLKGRRRGAQLARTFERTNGPIQPDWGIFAHNIGLGDHIVCNAIVRKLSPSYKILVLPVKSNNVSAVRWMFSDLPNIRTLVVEGGHDPRLVADAFERAGAKATRAGGMANPQWRDEMQMRFDAAFYEQAGVPFEQRWTAFGAPRDCDAEADLFRRVAPADPYIFVHDDAGRGYAINEARLPRGIVRIRPRPGLTDILFHYRKVIEGAAEVHCISSSFAQYLECLPSGRPQYLHRYPREDGTWSTWRNFQVLE